MTNFTATSRKQFAGVLRAVRADRSLRSYGRLSSFGRVIITDAFRVTLRDWTSAPPLNIHREVSHSHA